MRDETLREAKRTLRGFFASQPVEYLTVVADACRSGTFEFTDNRCCLRGLAPGGYDKNRGVDYLKAELAAATLAGLKVSRSYTKSRTKPIFNFDDDDMQIIREIDRVVRVRTLPLVLAEIRRRHRVPTAPPVEVACE